MTDTGPRVQLTECRDLATLAGIARSMAMNDVVPLEQWGIIYPDIPLSQLSGIMSSVQRVANGKKLTKRIRACIAKYKVAHPVSPVNSWTGYDVLTRDCH